jgi:glycosidase
MTARRAPLFALVLAGCGATAMPDGGAPDQASPPDGAMGDLAAGDAGVPPFATWPRDAILYHLYVRSFADSDGDGIGDLPGATAKLDYLAQLGVDGVLLLPIFTDAHPEYGGYGTVDWTHVAPAYGGDAAFDAFVAAAHARKLKVVLDLSLTIVSTDHPWFQAAAASPAAPERAHFLVHAAPCPQTSDVPMMNGWVPFSDGACYYDNYAPGPLADPNWRDGPTAQAGRDVAAMWLARGADGFRLDSAADIASVDPVQPAQARDPSSAATHAFWRAFVAAQKAAAPSSFTVAELFDHYADYFADGIDMALDYDVYFGLVDAWQNARTDNLRSEIAAQPPGAMGAVFLGNHDVPGSLVPPGGREADLLGGDLAREQGAALLLFSLPGTPFVYYGEELGLRGALPAGAPQGTLPWPRNPMQWDASATRGFTTAAAPWAPYATDATANVADEQQQAASLLATYRALIQLRKKSPALTHGDFQLVGSSNGAVLAFLRHDAASGERMLAVVSFAGADATTALDLAAAGVTSATVTDAIFGASLPAVTAQNASAWGVAVPRGSGGWYRLQ